MSASRDSNYRASVFDFRIDEIITFLNQANDKHITQRKRRKVGEDTWISKDQTDSAAPPSPSLSPPLNDTSATTNGADHNDDYTTILDRSIQFETHPSITLCDSLHLLSGFTPVSEGVYKVCTNLAELQIKQTEPLIFVNRRSGLPKMSRGSKLLYSMILEDEESNINITEDIRLEVALFNLMPKKLKDITDVRKSLDLEFTFDTTSNTVTAKTTYFLSIQNNVHNVFPSDITEKLMVLLDRSFGLHPTVAALQADIEINKFANEPIAPAMFYQAISENTARLPMPDFEFEVPELDVSLLPFQRKTVDWLLHKESVKYDPHTGLVTPSYLVHESMIHNLKKYLQGDTSVDVEQIDIEVDRILNKICFGWKRYINNLREIYWINKITGNVCPQVTIYRYVVMYYESEDKNEFPQIIPAQGLLAEEMGLGKTVEITALALLNPRPAEEVNQELRLRLRSDGDLKALTKAKTTLVVAPDSILKQWYDELGRLAPSLRTTIYKGMDKYKSLDNNARFIAQYLSKFDIVFTTYSTISRELDYALYTSAHKSTRLSKKRAASVLGDESSPDSANKSRREHTSPYLDDEESRPTSSPSLPNLEIIDQGSRLDDYKAMFQLSLNKNKDKSISHKDYEKIAQQEVMLAIQHNQYGDIHHQASYESPLMLLQFWRVVLDEVQMVSSSVSRAFQSAELIPRFHAWGVSGTPIKKNFDDLHSVLKYLRCGPFNYNIHKYSWHVINQKENYGEFINLWNSISIRHTKYMVRDDLHIPEQTRTLITTPFTAVEQENYNQNLEQCLSELCLDINGNPVMDSWEPSSTVLASMRYWLMKLRQICGNAQIGHIQQQRHRYKSAKNRDGYMVKSAQQLKTLENVLEDMLKRAYENINDNERVFIQTIGDAGQYQEQVLVPSESVVTLTIGAQEVEKILHKLKIIHRKNVQNYNRAKKQLQIHNVKGNLDEEDDDDNIGDDLLADDRTISHSERSTPAASDLDFNENDALELYAKCKEEMIASNIRLRSGYLTLHRFYFLLASAHFQCYDEEYQLKVKEQNEPDILEICQEITQEVLKSSKEALRVTDASVSLLSGIPEAAMKIPERDFAAEFTAPKDLTEQDAKVALHTYLESKLYEWAEDCRRIILRSSIKGVNKAVAQRITSRPMYSEGKYVNSGDKPLPKSTKAIFGSLPQIDTRSLSALVGGVKSNLFLQDAEKLIGQFNEQAKTINQWASHLIELLCKPLLSDGKNPDGEEYQQSFEDQDMIASYLQVIPRALTDRSEFTFGEESSIRIKDLKKQQDHELRIVLETKDDNGSLLELENQRKKIKPRSSVSLQELIDESQTLEADFKDRKNSVNPDFVNGEIAALKAITVKLRNIFDNEKLAQILLQKEITVSFNTVFNARIEYFKQLQSISDSVARKAFSLEPISMSGKFPMMADHFIHRLKQRSKKLTQDFTRFKYLSSLADVGPRRPGDENEYLCIICRSTITIGSITPCGHKYCKDCLAEWLERSTTCPTCKAKTNSFSLYHFTHYKPNISAQQVVSQPEAKNLHSIYKPVDERMIKELREIRLWPSYGSKVDLIIKQTLNLISKDRDVQIVIFSQWQDLLIILGAALRANRITFVGSRGTLLPEVGAGRHSSNLDSIEEFKDPTKKVTCFLLNAKAQASGLTLVNATHMFLCEPLVNTSLELQAIGRIHRIGQTKKTTVWMFAIENSVEESIVLMSTNKRLQYYKDEGDLNKNSDAPGDSTLSEKSGSDLSQAESMALMRSEGNAVLVGKKHGDGEEVTSKDLWEALFCAKNAEGTNPMLGLADST